MLTRRSLVPFLLLAAGCGSGGGVTPPPPPPPEPEVARPPVQLLVERYSHSGTRSYYTMAPDGSGVAPFDGAPAEAIAVVPSPDGRTLACLLSTPEAIHLVLTDRDGANRRPVVEGDVAVGSVSWSPDGTRLAFDASAPEIADDIFVVNADGTGLTDLTPDPLPGTWEDRQPAWSPDGTRIAFISNRSGGKRLWVMDPDGTDLARVVQLSDASEREAAWSADGAWLAFRSVSLTDAGIGLVRPDGSGYQVFPVAGDFGGVAWSPDGRVLFSGATSGNYEIHAVDPATGQQENLTHHLAHDFRARSFRWVEPAAWAGLGAPVSVDAGAPSAPALAAGDVTQDGRADLLLLAPAREQVRILASTAGGLLPAGLDAGPDQRGLAVTDVSRDGAGDVVVLGPQSLWVWRGGEGGPGLPTEHPLTGEGISLAVGDLDDDGSPDVCTVEARDGGPFHLLVHTAAPDGTLTWILDATTELTSAGRACVADVTGEGALDVLVLTSDPAAAVVLLPGHGDLTLGAPAVAATELSGNGAGVPICADLDGDRRADLALLQPGASFSLLRSDGVSLGVPVAAGATGTSAAAADLDRDGDVDLVVAGPSHPEVVFLRNRGDGTFARPVAFALAGAPLRLVAADMDGDGWTDVAVADQDGTVSVLRNLGRAPPG